MSPRPPVLDDLDALPWVRVSPRLVTARRLGLLWDLGLLLVIAVLALVFPSAWWWLAVAAVLALAAVGWIVIGRGVRAIGYLERENDLLVRRGILFRTTVVVPYGRMQYVDVTAGPLERAFGLSTVQLHTASAGTDASIPGLVPEQAAHLREALASRGEARLAGL